MRLAALPLAVLGLLAPGLGTAARAPQQAITLDAQSADVDLANNNVLFHKVKITQGDMSISADQGQGTKQTTRLDFDNSLWIFRGNVKITMPQGQLNSDDAQINFTRQLLSKAVVNGSPASFEQKLAKSGKTAEGRADLIDYDAARGIVHLTKDAWLSDGQTELRGESLKYNMNAQVIAAEGADQNSQRVHMVITPPANAPAVVPPKP